MASGASIRIAAGALPAWTSSSSTAEAEEEPIVPGSARTVPATAKPALGMALVDDPARARIDAAPEADRGGQSEAGAGRGRARQEDLSGQAHARSSRTRRPATALSTHSPSEP